MPRTLALARAERLLRAGLCVPAGLHSASACPRGTRLDTRLAPVVAVPPRMAGRLAQTMGMDRRWRNWLRVIVMGSRLTKMASAFTLG